MMKIITAILFGLGIGITGTYVFYTQLQTHTEGIAVQLQYKYLNNYLLEHGSYQSIKNQYNSYLSYLDTIEPNKYSAIPTVDALNIERTAAYYKLAILEKNNNNYDAYNENIDNAVTACITYAGSKEKCTITMLETLSCIFTLSGQYMDCTPNKSSNLTGEKDSPSS